MKNIFIVTFLILLIAQEAMATSSFKTYTPTYPYNGYNSYLPPPPHPSIHNQNYKDRFWRRRNYYNGNNYNYPYGYYPQRRSIFSSIGDFFSRGKMTGYTDSNFNNFPYAYQQQIPDVDYYFDVQNGSSIKILD